jgi:diacylglycerol kinase (ATP)
MSGIGIITNPHSKLNKRNPGRAALLGYILGSQGRLEVTNTLEDLGRVAREFKDRGIEILAINGGDGTISRTLTAFIHAYGSAPLPKIALLRGGTINMLATNLGIPGTPEQILFRLVEAYAEGSTFETRKISTLCVEENYGFLFGNGTAAAFLKEYYQHKSGPIGALLWAIRAWASSLVGGSLFSRVMKDFDITIRADDGPSLRHSTVSVLSSTVKKMPLGYPLFANMKEGTKGMECCSFTFNAKDAIWQFPLIMLKSQDKPINGKMSLVCNELTLEAEQPFDYTLDGELFVSQSSKLQIKTGPDIDFATL